MKRPLSVRPLAPRRAALLACALVALLAAALLAPAADAYRARGRPWPGEQITIRVASSNLRGVTRIATEQWNNTGMPVELVLTSSPDADVTVYQRSFGCGGDATLGFTYEAEVEVGRCPLRSDRILVVTHELGHVLGLDHEMRRCSIMNVTAVRGRPVRCPHALTVGEYIRADDLAGLRALYGEF